MQFVFIVPGMLALSNIVLSAPTMRDVAISRRGCPLEVFAQSENAIRNTMAHVAEEGNDQDSLISSYPALHRRHLIKRGVRCGFEFDNTKCTNGECCSAQGWCGKGNDYCSVPGNCQRAYGLCDSNAVPKGADLGPSTQPRPQLGRVPYGKLINKCTKPKTLALTFDDGPSNKTHTLLDVLRDHNAKATFFLSGNTNGKGMIDEEPVWINIIQRMINEGHQVGSHSWSHAHFDTVDRDIRMTDMIRNDRAIANILGKFPTYMRAPYLECTEETGCYHDMTRLGYHMIGFEVDSGDWKEDTSLEMMKSNVALRKGQDNMLLIQHDTTSHVIDLVKYVLELTKDWHAVTVGECLNDPSTNWYINLESVVEQAV